MLANPRLPKILVPLALLAVLAGCQAQTAPRQEARPVQVQRVTFANQNASRDFPGVVRARYETDLGFRVAGKIVARQVNVGDRVRAGDVVARLDAEDLKLQVQSAQAELAAATSNLAQTTADEGRYATLKAKGWAATAEVDRKKAARDEAEGRLERAKRALDLARNQLAYTELKADADGVITAAMGEPGQVVADGQAVARLAQRGEKEAVVAIPETWFSEARQAHASVTLWSEPDREFAAQLRELSPQSDAATRTYAARFTIVDPGDTVALGMTATVQLTRPSEARVARLPLSAVLSRGNGSAVFVVDETGKLALQPVQLAGFNEDSAFVLAGIKDGDKAVILGVQKLEAGTKVRSVEER
jgi:RND family efflux transporter MFP subunit